MQDLHVHTTYCHGQSTPREITEAAIAQGIQTLGFSSHGYTAHDVSYCMSLEGQAAYIREIRALQREFGDRIRILCGVEQDMLGSLPTDDFDYVIGSSHYFRFGSEYRNVDHSPEEQQETARTFFGGDIYALAEQYFENVSHVVEVTNCDIIGHFDLFSIFNEEAPAFDENHPRYVAAWQKAADALLKTGKLFEVNTGAICRGHKTRPYPAHPILCYLRDHGAQFVLDSDSHHKDTLQFAFDTWSRELEAMGIVCKNDFLCV